jgi:hypothetical protein
VRRSVWMHAWDLCGRTPDSLLDFLLEHGVNACSLGMSYHGGRMLLATHPERVVYQQLPGALYFDAAIGQFPRELRPAVAPEGAAAETFLARCAERRFPAEAWVVLCHQDALAPAAPQLAVRNAFGEAYEHALCPASETVRLFCIEVCRQAAAVPGVTGLDLEALSFLGYEHGGLHDKRGIPLSKELSWLLSICCCDDCRRALPGVDEEIRARVRQCVADPYGPAPALDAERQVLEWRRRVQSALLRRIREAVPDRRLNLRISPDPHFGMGKSSLTLPDIAGIADSATFTYFGSTLAAMADAVDRQPRHDKVETSTGFVFHEPDCRTRDDLRTRAELALRSGATATSFYCFGMAGQPHWAWLKEAIDHSDRMEALNRG